MKKILVCGAGGFIGHHLTNKLKSQGHWVRAVDLKYPEFSKSKADEFIQDDLTNQKLIKNIFDISFDEIYQLAADMGGAGYIFTGENDANVMYNSSIINLNILNQVVLTKSKKIFFSSSACIYPEYNQNDNLNPICTEDSAYPAQPDSDYGWEKLFSERLYLAFARNHKVDAKIARFHNIFGPEGTWNGGKEKAPAAICRKVAEAPNGGSIEIWGDGKQTRSFLYIDECLEGVERLMNSNFRGPINIGSEEMISINDLAKMTIKIANKELAIKNKEVKHIGVRGRKSDNTLIFEKLKWKPEKPLSYGMIKTYQWIAEQVKSSSGK